MTSRWQLGRAARCLAQGQVIAYPTEAVFGLGCDPWNRAAVERIFAIKGRSGSKGLILIADAVDPVEPLLEPLPPAWEREILASWPGPLTWVLPARPDAPSWLTGGRSTLAVRITAHPLAAALCHTWGKPLVSTSANRGGRPPARTSLETRLRLGSELDLILGGACPPLARPSTIRDGRTGAILRA